MKINKIPITFLLILMIPAFSFSATYYVATNGNDSNNGSEASPFRSIQKGADTALAGDSIIVKPGTYAGAKFSRSGTSASPILVQGQPGAIVNTKGPLNSNNDNLWIRNASYITIEGFEVHSAARSGIAVQGEPTDEVHGIVLRNNYCHNNSRWGIFTGYAEGIVIENNETSYSAIEHGIYVSNSADNPVITGNYVHHNNASGIQINADPFLSGDGIISNALIDSNIIHDNGAAGGAAINLASVINSVVRNNLLYRNKASGIAGWDDGEGSNQYGTHHNRFYNNTIIQPSDGRWAITLLNGSTNNEIKNNILLHLGTRGSINVDSSSETGLDSDYNAVVNVFSYNDGASFVSLSVWQSRGHDPHSFLSNTTALFEDPANDDYHLKSGSPAIDTGTFLSAVTDDLEGNVRPQGASHDIGAYESGAGCTDTSPPFTSITSPTGGQNVSGVIPVEASASDDCSVSHVEFYADGSPIGSDNSSPYSVTWNTVPVANGAHTLTSRAYDGTGKSYESSPVTVNVNNQSLFSDDFEDGDAAGWTFTAGTWSVLNGNLTGTAKSGNALSPNFGGCTICAFETDVLIQTASGRASVYGWYANNKNYVELQVQDDKNKIVLQQIVNGRKTSQKSVTAAISNNVRYAIKMSYDGADLRVWLDGVLIATLVPSSTPWGNVGFRVWSPNKTARTADFSGIIVY